MRRPLVGARNKASDRRRLAIDRCANGIGTLVAALAIVAQSAASQQPLPPRLLTLTEAIRIAERNNPAFRRVRAEQEVARAGEREALGALFPRLSTNLNFGGSSFYRVTAFDVFGDLTRLDDPLVSRSSSASQSVDLGLRLFDGGARYREVRAARLDARAADARSGASRLELRAEVTRRYFQAVGASRRITLEERLLVSAQEQFAATERLFRIAGASRADVLGSDAEVAARESMVEDARGEARKRLLALQEVLGVEDAVAVILADSLSVAFDSESLRGDVLLVRALSLSPRVIELAARAAALDRRAAAARASRWPTIEARAGFSRSLYDRAYAALFELNPPDRNFSFGFSASLPLFDGFQTSGRISRTEAAAVSGREELRAARLAAVRDVQTAIVDLETAQRRVRQARRSVALSREREELSRESYRVGAIRLIELQLVLDRTAAAEREELDARVAFAVARATLEEKVGGDVSR